MTERGAAAVLLIGVVGLVIVLAAGIADVGLLLGARVRAATAADAAALAAAPVTFAPFGATGGPAAEARRFAALNRARLRTCRCPIDRSWSLRVVQVEVEVDVRLIGFGTVAVTARSSAEFDPSLLLTGDETA